MVLADETKPGRRANAQADATEPKTDESGFGVFRGNFSHTLDDKGRVSLPVEFRKIIEDRRSRHRPEHSGGGPGIVLTNFISEGSRCLEGFTIAAWEAFERRLREKSRFSAKLQKLENFYLSRAAECPLDSTGRILVPTHLRTYAGLSKDVTFTSSTHGFRIWDTRVWNMIFSDAEKALLENPDLFADVDL